MSDSTVDTLFDTLDAINKHTSRLNSLDKRTKDSAVQLELLTKELQKQIESSSKEVLIKLLESNNTDKESLVKEISNTIATNIAKLSINAGNVTVNVETDSIAKVISKMPINNTNNIVVDTSNIDKNSIKHTEVLNSINGNLEGNLTVLKLMFQELIKNSVPPKVKVTSEKLPVIIGMSVNRDKDNLIESVNFIRDSD